MTLALLNGIEAPAVESELSLRDSGSGTLIQPHLQTWTHFNGALCSLETAIEFPAFQPRAQLKLDKKAVRMMSATATVT